MGINLFLVKSRSSTIQDLFLFVFTQDILHYLVYRVFKEFNIKNYFSFILQMTILKRLLKSEGI
ncbi:hypothetical protein SAG0014_09610 [Streptococcus agalactiae FSL S3-586]|nr:hypothetical protein SAG0014_09610 [Streptococcus agalactiae FSL S3-586]